MRDLVSYLYHVAFSPYAYYSVVTKWLLLCHIYILGWKKKQGYWVMKHSLIKSAPFTGLFWEAYFVTLDCSSLVRMGLYGCL